MHENSQTMRQNRRSPERFLTNSTGETVDISIYIIDSINNIINTRSNLGYV